MVILGLGGGGPKKDHHSKEEDYDGEETTEYSDDQLMMAGELRRALDDGDEHDILTAIHGIVMSYKDY